MGNKKTKTSIKTTPFLLSLSSSTHFTPNSLTPPNHHKVVYGACSFSLSLLPSHTSPLPRCGLSMSHSSFRKYPSALVWDPPEAAVRLSAPAWALPHAAETICSSIWSTSPAPSLSLVFPLLFLSLFIPSSSLWLAFGQRCDTHGQRAQLGPVVDPFRSCLEKVMSAMGQPLPSCHRGHSVSPHHYQNLATQTQYTMIPNKGISSPSPARGLQQGCKDLPPVS